METPRPTTLYLLCGKIAAGKSTLARQLAIRPRTLLIEMDHWMSTLFPVENRTINRDRFECRQRPVRASPEAEASCAATVGSRRADSLRQTSGTRGARSFEVSKFPARQTFSAS